VDDINKYMDYKYQNTYLVYKRLEFESNSLLSKVLLSGGNMNAKLQEIYEENFTNSSIVKSYDYGLFGKTENGDYMIRQVPYRGYNLIFIVSPFAIVFANYFPHNETYPRDERCLLSDFMFDHEKFSPVIPYDGYNFRFINTHEPFCEFCRDYFDGILSLSANEEFWRDVRKFVTDYPVKGLYDVVTLGSVVLIHGYTKKPPGFTFDYYNHGIVAPIKEHR
jgi:hypothetical protein